MQRIFPSYFLLLVVIFGIVRDAGAQQIIITGEIRDAEVNYTLSGVTVAAYSSVDSSLINALLTDNLGRFTLPITSPQDNVDLYVSFTGYKVFHLSIHIDSAQSDINIGVISLQRNYQQMNEVVIRVLPPVSMNGDTLEINPSAFRMGTDAVVEDLLRKVSGVVIWGDGTITVNGRKVDHVYVDGRPFISDNARIATQNLPKSIIEKVQVYQEKSTGLSPATPDSLLTMNIRLKEDHKNGLLGKAMAGYGSSGRYDLGLTGILFSRKSRLGLALLNNNVNKHIDGLQAALENSTYKNINPDLTDAPDFELDGQNRIQFYGAALQHHFIPKERPLLSNDLRAEITHVANKAMLNSEVTSSSLINNTEQTSRSSASNNTLDEKTGATVSYKREKANTNHIITAEVNALHHLLDGSSRIVQQIDGDPASESNLLNRTESRTKEAEIQGEYNYRDDQNLGLKSLNLKYGVAYHQDNNERAIENRFQSFAGSIPDLFFNRKYDLNHNIKHAHLNLSYPGLKRLLSGYHDVRRLEIRLDHLIRISGENGDYHVRDFDPVDKIYTVNPSLTYHDQSDSIQNKPGLIIRKSFKKSLFARFERDMTISLKLQENFLTLNNTSTVADRNLNRSFAFFEPEFSLAYDHQNSNRQFTLGYKMYFGNIVPGINQLFPVTDDIDPYNIRFGNTALRTEHAFFNTFSAAYKGLKKNNHHTLTAFLNGTYTYTHTAVSDSILYDEAGRKILFPVNVPYRKNQLVNLQVNYVLKLHDHMLQIQYDGSMSHTTIPGFINSLPGTSKYLFMDHGFRINFSFSDKADAEFHQHIYLNQFALSDGTGTLQRNNWYRSGLSAHLHIHKNIIYSNMLNYLHNPASNSRFLLWNMYLAYRLLKDKRGEVKFSAFDLLKNYKNIKTDVGYNFNSTTVNSGLQQFFMASFSYYPGYY